MERRSVWWVEGHGYGGGNINAPLRVLIHYVSCNEPAISMKHLGQHGLGEEKASLMSSALWDTQEYVIFLFFIESLGQLGQKNQPFLIPLPDRDRRG